MDHRRCQASVSLEDHTVERKRVKGLPVHTLVRGRFVMRDRTLVAETRGWGRSVHTIQQMPVAAVRNADETMRAIVQPPGALSIKGDVA